MNPIKQRINYLEIPENLKVNRKTIYKLIKNRVKLIDPQIIENYLSNIDNTGYQSLNNFRLKFKDIDSAKAFHLGNKPLNAQRLTADERETATQLENLFNTAGQFRLFLKDILNAIIARNDSNGNPLTVNANQELHKLITNYQIFIYSGIPLKNLPTKADLSNIEVETFDHFILLCSNDGVLSSKVYQRF